MNPRRAGFTIIELMITLAIVAILAVVSAPSLRDLVKNAQMTSLVNDLLTDLNIARSEAVKRGVGVSICTSNTGVACTATAWNLGWIVFAEANTNAGTATGTPGVVDGGEPVLKVMRQVNGATDPIATLITSANNPTQGGAQYLSFRPTGVVTKGGGGVSISFTLCDERRTGNVSASAALSKGRRITLIGSGRAQADRCTCASAGTTCTIP